MNPSTSSAEAALDATGSGHEPVGTAGLAQLRRADVVVSYDLGVECYQELWSPVILPAADGLISSHGPRRGRRSAGRGRRHRRPGTVYPPRWEGEAICAVAVKPGAPKAER
jgi:hypothetical protein